MSTDKDEAILLAQLAILESQKGIKDSKIIHENSARKKSTTADSIITDMEAVSDDANPPAASPVDPYRMRKEAIFDIAMSPETELGAGKPEPDMPNGRPETAAVAVPECWDIKDPQENKPE